MSTLKTVARNSLAGVAYATGLSKALRRRSQDSLVVLCYHRVLPEREREAYPMRDLVVTPSMLDAHLDYCCEHYECLPLQEAMAALQSRRANAKPLLTVTFDDGYWDNHEYARPILNGHGVRGTFFVIASLVGSSSAPWYDRLARAVKSLQKSSRQGEWSSDGDDVARQWLRGRCGSQVHQSLSSIMNDAKLLDGGRRQEVVTLACRLAYLEDAASDSQDRIVDRDELAKLADEGHEIGSHTRSHPILTQSTPSELADELAGSKNDLESILARKIVSCCYPNGDHNHTVIEATREAGYKYAVTTASGLNEKTVDPLRLRRISIAQDRLTCLGGGCSRSLLALELSGSAEKILLRRSRGGRA
ncbi:MAG: polysaccharide deacetylase family protein [Phycisphaerales bacterium]|nr:MAG: polysaccharide deacetylase family protein [Phycisphaerales bacterium]